MTMNNQITPGPSDENVAGVDSTSNSLVKQAIGNKTDAAATTVGTDKSMMAYLKGLITLLGPAGLDDVVMAIGPTGNPVVQRDVDSAVRYAVYLVNYGGNILTDAETAPGTFTVHRVRAGTDTEIVASTAATEASGVISATVDFTSGTDWDEGDLGYIEFTGITATVGGVTTELPIMRKNFRVSQEFDIESKVDTIDGFHDVPAADAVTNAQMRDVAGNKSDAAAAGAVSTTESLMAYLKQVVTLGRRVVNTMDFWSEIDDLVTITSTAATQALPSVTVADIPSGAVIVRVVAMLKYRAAEDTSGSDNSLVLAGTEHIQVDKSGGTYIDAIKLIASSIQVAASTRDGGDVWIGDIDVSSEVDGNDTYEFQWEGADATGNNLLIRDLQVGLRVYFTLE